MKKIAVLTGAGVSAESGISTFRDSDGLWENYPVEQVASIDGWYANPELVIKFHNMLRTKLEHSEPNLAHKLVAELENYYDVTVITQNVDDLHERGGSTKVIHLHGELTKACSENGKRFVRDIGYAPMHYGDRAEDGSLLRPFIVWFGEAVPLLEDAINVIEKTDILIIIGTSLVVYPAAGLVGYAPSNAKIYCIDPKDVPVNFHDVQFIKAKATVGMQQLFDELTADEKKR